MLQQSRITSNCVESDPGEENRGIDRDHSRISTIRLEVTTISCHDPSDRPNKVCLKR